MLKNGMVVKLTDEYAIVVTDESEYLKIKLKSDMSIGQKIYIHSEDLFQSRGIVTSLDDGKSMSDKRSRNHLVRRMSAIAAMVVIAVLIANPILRPFESPYAVVSLDVNPSFEISINKNFKVIDIEALNDDGKSVIQSNLKGQTLRSAVKNLVNNIEEQGFTNPTSNAILVSTVDFDNKAEDKINKEVAIGISQSVKDHSDTQSTTVVFVDADSEELEAAEDLNMSVGKYKLYKFASSTLKPEDVESSKISELIVDPDVIDDIVSDEDVHVIDDNDLEKLGDLIESYQENHSTEEDDALFEDETNELDENDSIESDLELDEEFEEDVTEDDVWDEIFDEEPDENLYYELLDEFLESEDMDLEEFLENEDIDLEELELEDIELDELLEEIEVFDEEFIESYLKERYIDSLFEEKLNEQGIDLDEFYNEILLNEDLDIDQYLEENGVDVEELYKSLEEQLEEEGVIEDDFFEDNNYDEEIFDIDSDLDELLEEHGIDIDEFYNEILSNEDIDIEQYLEDYGVDIDEYLDLEEDLEDEDFEDEDLEDENLEDEDFEDEDIEEEDLEDEDLEEEDLEEEDLEEEDLEDEDLEDEDFEDEDLDEDLEEEDLEDEDLEEEDLEDEDFEDEDLEEEDFEDEDFEDEDFEDEDLEEDPEDDDFEEEDPEE